MNGTTLPLPSLKWVRLQKPQNLSKKRRLWALKCRKAFWKSSRRRAFKLPLLYDDVQGRWRNLTALFFVESVSLLENIL